MTPTFCSLERPHDLSPVEVNVDEISYIEPKSATSAAIHFGVQKSIVVYGNAISVCIRIQDALPQKPRRRQKRAA
jgi:hypothetical protein